MKRMIVCFVAVLSAMWSAFGVTVTNVRGEQRQGSKLVDIYYDLNSTDGGTYTVEVVLEGDTETVQAVSLTGDIGKGVKPGENRHVVWDAGVDWVSKKGYVKAVVTAEKEGAQGVQLWEGGPYWADRNIGADEPWEYGYYFWWGDTVGYKYVNGKWVASDGSNSNFSFYDDYNTPTWNKSISILYSEGWITLDGILTSKHDAAHVHCGGNWRMPTDRELKDLSSSCDWIYTKMNDVDGFEVRGKGGYSSNTIFLPCSGLGNGTMVFFAGSDCMLWSSVMDSSGGNYPRSLSADNWYVDYVRRSLAYTRCSVGLPIRPLQENSTSVYGATSCSAYFYVTTDVKVRLVATEGVLVDEDGNPIKDENGKFITEVTQEFLRDKSVSLMKNPFKRGSNIFLGWSRNPDVDLRKEVYENRKSLDQVLYPDEASLYFDAENPEEEVTLYAIWTVSLRCSFNNLEPEDLKNHLYWRCLGQVIDGKPEEYWSDCRDGESVELLPGSHDIYFGLKEGYSWIVDNQELLRMKESIHLPSASSSLIPPMLSSDHGWGRSIAVDVPYVKSEQIGSVMFKCIPETSRTLGIYELACPFDLSKITIKILPLYSNGLKTEPIVIKNGDYVTLPAGKYQALISYDNSASSGEGFSWYATEGWSSYYHGFEVEPANYQKVIPVNFALDIVGQPVYRDDCTVRFDPQGGKVDVSELTFMRMIREDLNQPKKNAVITYLPKPTRPGKWSIGWWTEPMPTWKKVADGLKASDWLLLEIFKDTGRSVRVGDEISDDCTLYARWVRYDSSMTVDEDKLTGVSTEIRTVTVPYTIHFVSVSAFELVEEPMSIVFAGDAPEVEEGAFEKLPADSVVYVKRSSSGWNTDIPGIWNGVKIEYVDDVIPAIANESEIRNVFSGMADGERLSSHIKDVDGYNYFRIWSMYSDNINPLEVKSSPNAWLSYALDADGLIADAPKDGDVVITNFEKTATAGAFEFTVKIDGIEVGDNALESNIRKEFDIEGSEKLVSGGTWFNSDKVELNAAVPENGNVKFTVTPKMDNGESPNSFFIRVKMK